MTAPDSPELVLEDPDYESSSVPQPVDSEDGHILPEAQWADVEADQLYYASNFAVDPTLPEPDLVDDPAELGLDADGDGVPDDGGDLDGDA